MVLDPSVEERLKAEREASGADRYDEVWEGVYMMAPLANNEHQDLQAALAAAIKNAIGWGGPVRVHAGANVSDREEGWLHNYRIPDVVVVFPGSSARDCDTHWCGGPDFVVEIASPGDRSRDKLDFYAGIGVRELLLVDREPWSLELLRLSGARLELIGRSDLASTASIASTVVPVSFRLIDGTPRPRIDVTHRDGVQRWIV
ncbi:MAG: Uma2 family endonuclease [Tepidisphaeraceae bacterium]